MQKVEWERVLPDVIVREDGDYFTSEGVLMCGKCNTPKMAYVTIPGMFENRPSPRPCKCDEERMERESNKIAEKARRQRIEEIRREGITDARYKNATFDKDDRANPTRSDACMRYVAKWEEMYLKNTGIMLYGDVGTGKTFLASCIANALAEKGVKLRMTTLPELVNAMSANYGKERLETLDSVKRYDLLILDDFGMSKFTPTAMEDSFSVINARSLACKPLIVTTNLNPDDMKNEKNMQLKRIYSRVFQMTKGARLFMGGEDRRFK